MWKLGQGHVSSTHQPSLEESSTFILAFQRLARCTCTSTFERSSSGILPVRGRLCGLCRGPTSIASKDKPHRQLGRKARASRPHKIVRFLSSSTSWHCALTRPSRYRYPKTKICLTQHPTRERNGNLSDCSNG
jgi:hypothetical protein